MRIAVFFITAFIQLVVAFLGFFILLIGLNGFSENQATASLIFYIALAFLSALGLGAGSSYTAKRLIEKHSFGKFGASIIAIIGFALLGALILFIGWIAALSLAEILHKWK